MVVLEEGSMLTTGHNQYLQPDYLSPLPTTLDAKKSPLALLAQTCSQIGADSPSKPLMSSLEKPSKGSSAATNARSPPAAKLERTRGSPSDGGGKSTSAGLAFKPYETNVVAKRPSAEDAPRPASKTSSVHSASGSSGPDSAINSANSGDSLDGSATSAVGHAHGHKKSSSASRGTPLGRKSASPASSQHPANHGGGSSISISSSSSSTTSSSSSSGGSNSNSSSPSGSERKSPGDADKRGTSPRTSSGASPIIRSGMEVLSGHSAKDAAASLQSMYKAGGLAAFGANSLCCPPGLTENPAFRPPFAGASPFSHHHAAAAALLGYPGTGGSPGAAASPYLSYARVKTPSGGESLVPVCKDPYCTGCQYSVHNAQMMMAAASAGACPSGCTQCDHQKYGLMALSSLGPMPPPPPSLAGYPGSPGGGRPHVCNWIAGDSYCGKRFATSEELLQHLRSHTSLAGGQDPSAAATAAALLAAGQHSHPLLSPSAALHRAAAGSYPTPSLSPLGARYHPYGKPPPTGPMPASLPASLAASPYSAFNALGPYYSPYAIYGQRIGAAVHP